MSARSGHYRVEGMSCASCVARVEKAIRANAPGATDVRVNLSSGQAVVEGDAAPGAVLAAIERAGYRGFVDESKNGESDASSKLEVQASREERHLSEAWRCFFVSALLTLPVFVLGMFHLRFPGSDWLQAILSTGALAFAGRSVFTQAAHLLRYGQANMDTLIALGTGVAYLYSLWNLLAARADSAHPELYFETATMILTLVLYGRYLEARARARASGAIRALMELQPAKALVRRPGRADFEEISVEEVRVGDVLLVRPGDRVPVDGVVLEGASVVDESMTTGESLPVEKLPGSAVIGGSLNAAVSRSTAMSLGDAHVLGSFVMRADKVGAETTLAQIIRLVESAQESKVPIQRLADKVAGVFVPVVLGIAALTAFFWLLSGAQFSEAMRPFIAVLVIACPCALGLATPTAIQAATGRAAALGILVRNGATLETLRNLDVMVLDKTGTLTEGAPKVTDLVNNSGLDDAIFLANLAALESRSEHPLGRAVVEYARDRGVTQWPEVQDFRSTTGFGVEGRIADEVWRIGRELAGDSVSDEGRVFSQAGKTPLFVFIDNRPVGLLAVRDTVKPEAARTIAWLERLGVRPIMLTGDREEVARAIAREIGLVDEGDRNIAERVLSQTNPADKWKVIESLQQQGLKVGMVGDGVNDAPALAQADVGVAMGTGSDVALETADMTLLGGDPLKIPQAIELSRFTLRIVRQNLFWAFVYNVIGIPIAGLGWLNPMLAAGAMAFSSVSVVTNSLRLRDFRPSQFDSRDR